MKKFELNLKDGRKVAVQFEADKFPAAGNHVHHLEFHGYATSETGYRSHFFFADQMGKMNIEEFALEVAEALAKETKPVNQTLF